MGHATGPAALPCAGAALYSCSAVRPRRVSDPGETTAPAEGAGNRSAPHTGEPTVPTIAIVSHSGFGHTRRIAEQIAEAARASAHAPDVKLFHLEDSEPDWDALDNAECIVMGCPTYMGMPSAGFKAFAEASSGRWMKRAWLNKLAAGFTNSGSLHGDKQNTLVALLTLAAQHGMIWITQAELATPRDGEHGGKPDDPNRMGASIGLMAQSDNRSPDEAPSPGDLETARRFGQRIAEITAHWTLANKPA